MQDYFFAGNAFAGYDKSQTIYLPTGERRATFLLACDIHASEVIRYSGETLTAPSEPGLYFLVDDAYDNTHMRYRFIRYA